MSSCGCSGAKSQPAGSDLKLASWPGMRLPATDVERRAYALLSRVLAERGAIADGSPAPGRSGTGMRSVLEGGERSPMKRPVGHSPSSLRPVNHATATSASEGRDPDGLVGSGGPIRARKLKLNVHSKQEVPSHRGKNEACHVKHINFESEWMFDVHVQLQSGKEYWVYQELSRMLILYCPYNVDLKWVFRKYKEYFRVRGREAGPDFHFDPFVWGCNIDNDEYCQMLCYEIGFLDLKVTDGSKYPKDVNYARPSKSENRSSVDHGKTWSPPEEGGESTNSPPEGLGPVSDTGSYYLATYYIEHCVERGLTRVAPLSPGNEFAATRVPGVGAGSAVVSGSRASPSAVESVGLAPVGSDGLTPGSPREE